MLPSKDVHIVGEKSTGGVSSVFRRMSLPGGATAHILRRDAYEQACAAANKAIVACVKEIRRRPL